MSAPDQRPRSPDSADVAAPPRWRARAAASGSTPSSCPRGATARCCASPRSAVEDPERADRHPHDPDRRARRRVDITPLAELLADPAIEVVLHAGRQDVAILRRAWRTELTNIFDTQIAAGFVGESAQAGYGNLISSVLGLRVGKTASYTRWDARPLTAEQLSYAAEDVAHLLQLADALQRRLQRQRAAGVGDRGVPAARVARATSATRRPSGSGCRASASSTRRRAPSPGGWRPGVSAPPQRGPAGRPGPPGPAAGRDRQAPPPELGALGQIRGIHPSFIKRRGAELLEAIGAGLDDPPIPREGRRGHSDASDSPLDRAGRGAAARARDGGRPRLRADRLAQRARADHRRRAPVGARARCAHAEGWRRELVGADLESLLSGRAALAVGG